MRKNSVGIGILLTILTLSMTLMTGVGAVPTPPSDEDFKEAAIEYMIDNHPELEALDSDDWDFTLIGFTTSRFKVKLTYAEGPDNYELTWIGVITWNRYSDSIRVTELFFEYEVDLTVEKVGPGTTNPGPGVYTVSGGDSYSFNARAAKSENPDDYYFRFVEWRIDDGDTVTTSTSQTLSGTAITDLTITAVFTTNYITTSRVYYEDGLSMGYMWRDDHVIIVVRPQGESFIAITIESDYGTFTQTYMTHHRTLCIYFKPYWFDGDYTITVTAINTQIGEYTPSYQLAGLE